MDQKTVDKLEQEVEQAITGIVARLRRGKRIIGYNTDTI